MSACLPTMRPIVTRVASDSRLRSLQAKISGSWSGLMSSDQGETQKTVYESSDRLEASLVHDGRKGDLEWYDVRAEALQMNSLPEPADGIVVRSNLAQNRTLL